MTVSITAATLDAQWQQHETHALNQQRLELGNHFRLAAALHREQAADRELAHKQELGRERLYWIERMWMLYYNGCLLKYYDIPGCLERARTGYVEGVLDAVKPGPGWDFNYVQFGRYLEEG